MPYGEGGEVMQYTSARRFLEIPRPPLLGEKSIAVAAQ